MNRFNQILIKRGPSFTDHDDRNIYIYLLRGWGASSDNSITYPLLIRYFPFSLNFEADFASSNLRNSLTEASSLSPSPRILSKSLSPSSSLAFWSFLKEKLHSFRFRVQRNSNYPITFQIRYNFEGRGGHKESNGGSIRGIFASVFTANTYLE